MNLFKTILFFCFLAAAEMMYSNIFSEAELCNQLSPQENNVPGIYVSKTKKQAVVSCSIQSEKLLLKAAGHIPSSVRLMERDYSDFLFSGFFCRGLYNAE